MIQALISIKRMNCTVSEEFCERGILYKQALGPSKEGPSDQTSASFKTIFTTTISESLLRIPKVAIHSLTGQNKPIKMQLTLPMFVPMFVLAATASAQNWPQGGNNYQQPSNYQPAPPGGAYPPGPPQGNQGGSWSYQSTYQPPAPVREFKTITPSEADDWRSCTNGFLLSIDRGEDGSGPACNCMFP